MQLKEVIEARAVVEALVKKEMNGKSALEFAKFAREVFVQIRDFEAKRGELIQKYGEVIGEGSEKRFQVLPKNEKKYTNAIKRVLTKKVSIEPVDLGTMGITITPSELINALGLFK